MPQDKQDGDKGSPPTAESSLKRAASVFEGLLSDEEQGNARETPPAPKKEKAKSAEPQPEPEVEPESEPESGDTSSAVEEGAEVEPENRESEPEVEETEPESETEPKVPTFKVRVDGKDTEVTLDELLGGYSRTQDYTRKTQALAEQRKTVEAEAAKAREQRAQYAEVLEQAQQALNAMVPKEPNWTQLKSSVTPEEFTATWDAWQQFKTRRDSITAQQDLVAKAEAEDRTHRARESVGQEYEKLLEALPDWKDEAKAQTEREALVSYVRGIGVTDQEIAAVNDHRLVLVIRKAMLWDQLQAKKPTTQAKVAGKPKIKSAAPGSPGDKPRPPSEKKRALERLAKTGRVEDAAKAFMHLIPD